MTEKRFTLEKSENQDTIYDNEGIDDYYHLGNDTRDVKALCKLLNELHEENQQLIQLLKNQSAIIQELHSKLLEYQLKEPIILTREDLETMGGAISYYTHGRCGE